MYYFICRPTISGILTGIYDAWDFALRIRCPEGSKVTYVSKPSKQGGHDLLRLVVDGGFHFRDYSKFIDVLPNDTKAELVSNTIARRLGDELRDFCLTAILSGAKDRADTLYRFLLYAFGIGHDAIDHTERTEVRYLRSYYQSVLREGSLLFGFPGFEKLSDALGEIYIARLRPKNDVLDLIARHFVNQRPHEIFLLYNENNCTYVLHIPDLPLYHGKEQLFPNSSSERAKQTETTASIRRIISSVTSDFSRSQSKIAMDLLCGA